MKKQESKAMWSRVLLLLLASNVIILVVNLLRANFVDTVGFSLTNLLDPRFWIRNPALLLILVFCAIWFFSTILASQSASVASQTKLTASIYQAFTLGLASVFTLVNLAVYQALRKEVITRQMWIWAGVATACIVISCIAWYMFLVEGQGAVT
ncbi:MAG: hypothetical protein JSV12_06145 [Candidatus Bathyarchaeota archaeon]|nr:MAG: hypothetical protein JSV12_06145 [Candidatus Bathyarchaeota archaeon]